MSIGRSVVGKRQFLCGCCASLAAASVPRFAAAASDPTIVPVEMAPFHMLPFENEFVRLLNVKIPAGKVGSWHKHSLDFAQVYLGVSPIESTRLDGKPPSPFLPKLGEVVFTGYSKQSLVHQVANVGDGDFHTMAIEILDAPSGRFSPRSRPEPYTMVMDSERVLGWRLILQPGQSAPSITQTAPAVRFVVQGGDIVEGYPDQKSHELNLTHADFAWQSPGSSRSVANVGNSVMEFVEFELK